MSHPNQAQLLMERVKETLFKYERQLALDRYPILNIAHEKTQQPRIYIALAACVLALLVAIQIFGLAFLSNCFAFIPIYASFKALRSPEKSDDEEWLTYWVVYGSLGLFESFFDTFMFWLPLYYLAKIAFLAWCFAPQTRGAVVIYRRFLGPMFGVVEAELDSMRETIKQGKRRQ